MARRISRARETKVVSLLFAVTDSKGRNTSIYSYVAIDRPFPHFHSQRQTSQNLASLHPQEKNVSLVNRVMHKVSPEKTTCGDSKDKKVHQIIKPHNFCRHHQRQIDGLHQLS